MTTLEERARLAVDAIEHSVADYEAPLDRFATARRRHAVWAGAGWALVGSAAAASVVAAALFTPTPGPEVATTLPEPAVTGTLPTPDTTEVPAPEDTLPPVEVAPPTTEASATTEAPPTTVDATPPDLLITAPEPNQHFETEIVAFSGITEPGATVIAGGKWEASVDAEGRWSIALVLSPGANGASFVASDAAGNQTTARITVHLDVPAEEPPKEEPPGKGVDFTAYATFGSCELTPPYDVYYGTADPGTKVTITSAYGSGSVYANGEGQWEKQVFFETVPYGQPFVVTVKDHNGTTKQFEFVSWAGGA